MNTNKSNIVKYDKQQLIGNCKVYCSHNKI